MNASSVSCHHIFPKTGILWGQFRFGDKVLFTGQYSQS